MNKLKFECIPTLTKLNGIFLMDYELKEILLRKFSTNMISTSSVCSQGWNFFKHLTNIFNMLKLSLIVISYKITRNVENVLRSRVLGSDDNLDSINP